MELSDRFTAGVRANVPHWEGRWVGPRTGLDAVARRKYPSIAPAKN